MDKTQKNEILKAYGSPILKGNIKGKETTIVFSRCTDEDCNSIEKESNKKLINHWKSLVFLNHIYGQVSLKELQEIYLIELEMYSRPYCVSRKQELRDWFDKSLSEFENNER